jgi:hypothetical protein
MDVDEEGPLYIETEHGFWLNVAALKARNPGKEKYIDDLLAQSKAEANARQEYNVREGWEEDSEGWEEDSEGWEDYIEGWEEDSEGWEDDSEGWGNNHVKPCDTKERSVKKPMMDLRRHPKDPDGETMMDVRRRPKKPPKDPDGETMMDGRRRPKKPPKDPDGETMMDMRRPPKKPPKDPDGTRKSQGMLIKARDVRFCSSESCLGLQPTATVAYLLSASQDIDTVSWDRIAQEDNSICCSTWTHNNPFAFRRTG